MITLEKALARGRDNNLDLLRLMAACAVVVSHAWPLALGRGTHEPLEALLGLSLGGLAVLVFFFLSGLLVSASAARNRATPGRFVRARALRIFPGLAMALIVTAFLAQLSGASENILETGVYILRGLSLVSLQHEIPGAFSTTPYASVVNGPLWTLFYEVACYALIAGAIWTGGLDRWTGWAFALAATLMLWAFPEPLAQIAPPALTYRLTTLAPLLLAFMTGAAFWRLRCKLLLDWRIATGLALVSLPFIGQTIALPLHTLTLGYLICLLAFRLPVIKLGGDISYGIYIYGWPVAQALVFWAGPLSPETLAILGLLAVFPIAAASWLCIEKPALSLLRKPGTRGTRVLRA